MEYRYHSFSTYSSFNGHLSYFHFLHYRFCCYKHKIVGHFLTCLFYILCHIPRNGTAGRFISVVWTFSVLTYIVAALVYLPTKRVWAFPPHPWQQVLIVFQILVDLTKLMWKVNVVFICVSLIATEPEHFSLCLLVTWFCSFQKCLLISLTHYFAVVEFLSPLQTRDVICLSVVPCAKIFLPFCWWILCFVDHCLCVRLAS